MFGAPAKPGVQFAGLLHTGFSNRDHAGGVSPMMLSPHPMDHAQKRALQGTNGISGLGLRPLRLPSYTPALFLARCAATFVAYPAQNLIRAHESPCDGSFRQRMSSRSQPYDGPA